MNWIDITCLTILIIPALIGLYRGFLRSIFRIVAWILGIVGSYCSHLFLSDIIIDNFDISSGVAKIIALILGFVIPFTIAQLVGHFLHTAVSHSFISKPNRILGALFGIIKGLVVCFLLLSIMHILPLKEGAVFNMRETAFAYEAYKESLNWMGYPTEQSKLIQKAEKKAAEISKEITEKATDKAVENAGDFADMAKNAAINAAEKAVEKVVEKASEDAAEKTAKKAAAAIIVERASDKAESAMKKAEEATKEAESAIEDAGK